MASSTYSDRSATHALTQYSQWSFIDAKTWQVTECDGYVDVVTEWKSMNKDEFVQWCLDWGVTKTMAQWNWDTLLHNKDVWKDMGDKGEFKGAVVWMPIYKWLWVAGPISAPIQALIKV